MQENPSETETLKDNVKSLYRTLKHIHDTFYQTEDMERRYNELCAFLAEIETWEDYETAQAKVEAYEKECRKGAAREREPRMPRRRKGREREFS